MIEAASAISEHPLATHAVGEVAGSVLDRIGPGADLVFAFATGDLTGALEDIAPALRTLLETDIVIGATACGVLEGRREVEDSSALSIMALRGLEARLVRFEPGTAEPVGGWAALDPALEDSRDLVLLADPFSSPVSEIVAAADALDRPIRLHGGLASAGSGPGGNRLIHGRSVFDAGAVGVCLRGATLDSAVSQGCRPIGQPLTVTGSVGNVVTELASEAPLPLLRRLALEASEVDRARMASGLHVGLVIDEGNPDEFTTGDFLIRGLLGADHDTGAIAIGAPVELGATIQFHVRDAETATADLHRRLADSAASAAIAFTCNGRGKRLFGSPDHDAAAIVELTGASALTGMFCAGEIGPIGGRNHVHGFTASTLLISDSKDLTPC